MTAFRKTGEKGRYDFRDAQCIEAECWQPGEFFVRGATGGSGSRSTGKSSFCCMRRAYHGCPNEIVHLPELAKQRKAEGWKKAG